MLETSMPTASAIANSIAPTIAARTRAESRVAGEDRRGGWATASSRRRPKPDSKSRAIPKPVKTPPKAEAWSRTKANSKAV